MTGFLMLIFHVLLTLSIFLSMDAVITLEKRMTSLASASSIPEPTPDIAYPNFTEDRQIDPESRNKTGQDCGNGTKHGAKCSLSSNDVFSEVFNRGNTTSEKHSQPKPDQLNDKHPHGYEKLCWDYAGWNVSLKFYDPDTKICCNGLFDKVKPSEECCNGNRIDVDEQVCCGDQAINRSNDAVGCCRNAQYFTNDTLCCNGTLHEKAEYAACCGDRIISELTEICCQGRAFPRFDRDLACCDSKAYDKNREVCCNGTVQSTHGLNKSNGACCGTVFYDSRCYTCNADSQLYPLNNTLENFLGIKTCCFGKIKIVNDKTFCCENGSTDEECLLVHISAEEGVLVSHTVGSPPIVKIVQISTGITIGSLVILGTLKCFIRRKHRKRRENEDGQPLIENGTSSNDVIHRYPSMPRDEPASSPNMIGAGLGIKMNNNLENKNNVPADTMCNDTESMMTNHTENISSNDQEDTMINRRENLSNNNQEDTMTNHTEKANKDTDDHIQKPLYGGQSFTTFADMLQKKQPIYTGNELRDHYKDIGCQTIQKENSCNRRTIFGNPFEHSSMLDLKNPTFVMPWSEVKVRLPDSILQKHPVEMHGTSFDNITSIHDKIKISEDEMLVSPAVEYVLTGVSAFDDYAVVTMPFIGDTEGLRVWKFLSDDGMQTKVEPIEVPPKTKQNQDQSLFYEIDGRNVRIFTKSFSGFFQTNETHNRGPYLSLHAYLFGSHKRFQPNCHEIRLRLYIADEIMKFKDYRKELFQREEREDRTMLIDTDVNLTETVNENDTLKAVVTVWRRESQYWSHVEHPLTNQPVFPEIQEKKFCEIVQQCPGCPGCHFRQRMVPFAFEWYMTSDPQFYPSDFFKCFVGVTCVTPIQQRETHLIVQELRLGVEHRLPHEEFDDVNRFRNLKRYLTRMEDEKQERFNETIKRKYDCQGTRIVEVIDDLQRKMKPVGIYEAIVASLQLGHMYRELSDLQDRGFIPDRFFPRPSPRSGLDESDMRNSCSDRRGIDHGQTTTEIHNTAANQDGGTPNQYHVETNGNTQKAPEATGLQAEGGVDSRRCRNELGSDLPVCSYDLVERNENRQALVGFHGNHVPSDAKGVEMGQMGDNQFPETVPQQEQASFDETDLKECP